jgi:ubiquinone/menaquinone biosynthesis C-methylase UbiE
MSSTVDTWDAVAARYDSERANDAIYSACIREAHAILEVDGAQRILDAGCGTGLTTVPLCRQGRLVVGADYSHDSLKVLQRKHVASALAQADVCALPFADSEFDAVLCANTLQHLTPAQQPLAMRELRRVLKPTGLLVLTVHHYSTAKQRKGWIKEGKPGQPGIDYIYRFTLKDLLRLAPDADIRAIGLHSRLEPYLSPAMRRFVARRGHGHMLMAVVRQTCS